MVDFVEAVTRLRNGLALALGAVVLAACGQSTSPETPGTLRLGYFPNLTHAPALIGVSRGLFAEALGRTTLETHTFNAGPEAVMAILSDSIDAAFIGPNPTTNAFVQSHGKAARVIAGSTSGGALLVVKPEISSIADLRGRTLADPQLGGTQDVALRSFLKANGFRADVSGGGDVSVVSQDNSQSLMSFRQRRIDGAWVPEPWASRLVAEGGGKVLVDERDLWPHGEFVTTDLMVSVPYLQNHGAQVKALLEGLYQSIAYIKAHETEAQAVASSAVSGITGQHLASAVTTSAWGHMSFTLDPLAPTLRISASHAQALGLLPSVNLDGLYDLRLLNEVLQQHGDNPVTET